ncbi:MAG: protein phosphatase 2C domain-containing protein [Candidatus Electryoneaceae bacterium]|nr:protein phosphatase 2C domain-containing protein [Candidatus Electryoneaceae bacterium]
MKLHISAVSDVGLVRKRNEDMILLGKKLFRDDNERFSIVLTDEEFYFISVADGMGGHKAGDVASELVLQKMAEKLSSLKLALNQEELNRVFTDWTHEIHRYVDGKSKSDWSLHGMGTTMIGVLFYNGKAYYANVGDSRLYIFSDGRLTQISRDHTLREMSGNPNIPSNIIVNSFGGLDEIFLDFGIVTDQWKNGDVLMLCSDGLSDMLSDEEMELFLSQSDPLEILLDEAKNKGGRDNISIILASVETG